MLGAISRGSRLVIVVLQVLLMRLQKLMPKAVKAPQCPCIQNMRALVIHQPACCPRHLPTSHFLHLQPQGRSQSLELAAMTTPATQN